MTEEAKRKQRNRRQICVKFSDTPADWLLFQHIKKHDNVSEYIRKLVWHDLAREVSNGKED